MLRSVALAASTALPLAGSVHAQMSRSLPEQTEIMQWQSTAPPEMVKQAAKDALLAYEHGWRFSAIHPADPLPASPGRFSVNDPTGKGPLSLMKLAVGPAALSSLKSTSCPGAILDMSIYRDVDPIQSLHAFVCLYQFQTGYALDIFLTDEEEPPGSPQAIRGGPIRYWPVPIPAAWEKGLVASVAGAVNAATASEPIVVEGQVYETPSQAQARHEKEERLKSDLAAAPEAAGGIELWRGATVGMNRNTIAAKFPGSGADRNFYSEYAYLCDFAYRGAKVAGAGSEARFCFDHQGQLQAVRIEVVSDFGTLRNGLEQKFGRPGTCTDLGTREAHCAWAGGGVSVDLGMSQSRLPKIVYRATATDGL